MTDETKTALLSKPRAPVADERAVLVSLSSLHEEASQMSRSWADNLRVFSGPPTDDEIDAYEEGYLACAISRQSAALASAPVADELPHWEEISAKLERDETLTPLELFIHENEPAGGDADAWRDQLAAAQSSAPVAGEAQPVAWFRKTDITEWTDTEPETDGWTPLFDHAAPQASEAVRDAEDAARWRWATASDGNADKLCAIVLCHGGYQDKINERADFYRAALSAQPGAQKQSRWQLLADAIEKLGPGVPETHAGQWLQLSGSIRFGTDAVDVRGLSLVPHPKQHNDGGADA